MFIDITTKVTPKMIVDAQGNEKKSLVGHLGTHFDVMNKEFPLSYIERKAIVFDVKAIRAKEISISDIAMDKVVCDMFVAFYTGFIEDVGYGSSIYFKEHPQLSNELMTELVKKGISIIGIDFAGVRRGREHTPKDQELADTGVFVIENLCNLATVLDGKESEIFIANTYPVNYTDMTGLPCRVVAKIF